MLSQQDVNHIYVLVHKHFFISMIIFQKLKLTSKEIHVPEI